MYSDCKMYKKRYDTKYSNQDKNYYMWPCYNMQITTQKNIFNQIYIEVNMYIGFWTLKMKCTQYGFHEESTFKNAKAVLFLKLGGAGGSFRLEFIYIYNFLGGSLKVSDCEPRPLSTSP